MSAAAADERHCENELIRSRDEHRARLSGITLRRRVDFNFKPRRRPSHGGSLEDRHPVDRKRSDRVIGRRSGSPEN